MTHAGETTRERTGGDDIVAFLRQHPPFAGMADDVLEGLAPKLARAGFARHATIVAPEQGPVAHLYIVEKGLVGSRPHQAQADPDRTLGPGALFPVGALSTGGGTTRVFTALRDTACLLLQRDDFLALRATSPEFEHFCAQAITETLRQSLDSLYG